MENNMVKAFIVALTWLRRKVNGKKEKKSNGVTNDTDYIQLRLI